MNQAEDCAWADSDGIWIKLGSGQVSGIPWGDVQSIELSGIDCKTHVLTMLTFNSSYGEFLEVSDALLGFDSVLEKVQERYPGVRDRMFKAKSLSRELGSSLLWCHS